jgi:tetratricopeptide (TPR) repeat protein
MNHHRRWLVLLPALIVLLVYLPALNYEFVWDDAVFLSDLSNYRDPAIWSQALGEPLTPNYFRPFGVFIFVLELRLWGTNPALFHLTSLLLHAINTVLIAILAQHLMPPDMDANRRQWLQVGAGLIYGLHPALLEGVTFIASWFDPLLTFFLLSALLADVNIRHRVGRPLGVAVAFLLAALSKEMALAFVFVLPLWHLARRQRSLLPLSRLWRDVRESGDLGTYAGVLVAGGVYLVLRYAAMGYLLFLDKGASIAAGNPLQQLLLIGRSVTRYVVLIIWPFTNLTPIHYSPLPVPTGDIAAWASLAVVVALVAGLVLLVKRVPQSGWLAIAGTVSLFPVVNLFPLELDGGAFVAERFLLFPVALFTLALVPLVPPLVAWWRTRVSRIPIPVWTLPLLWLVVSVATIQLTLPHWRDDLALWTWGERRAPASWLPPTNLALAYNTQGSYQRALAAIDRALSLDPEQANAWNNLGLSLFALGNYAEAQSAFEEAVRLEPESAVYLNNLAAALREQDRLEEAQQVLLEEVLPRSPDLPVAHLNLGIVYMRMERPDLAVQHLQEALRLLPPEQQGDARALLAQMEDPGLWLRLGDSLLASGDPERALAAFDQARMLGAQPAEVASGLSAALIELGALSEAEAVLQQALQQAPDDARLYNNLGVVAREQGDLDAARQYFERAVELAPDWDLPRENLESLEPETP